MIRENSCLFEESNISKVQQEMINFINNTKNDLNIIFPHYINDILINNDVIKNILSKKLNEDITIKILYQYNENNKKIIKKITPFVLMKRLEFSISSTYTFFCDSSDYLAVDLNNNSTRNQPKEFKNANNINNKKTFLNESSSIFYLHSNNYLLLSSIGSFFKALWFQKETFDKMIKEKSHSELLIDLITHDIGNHHSIVQGGLDLITDLIEENLKNSNNKAHHPTILPDKSKDNQSDHALISSIHPINEKNNPLSQYEFHDMLNDIMSYASKIQSALDRSNDLVRNIIKLEKLYRQKQVFLYKKNIVTSMIEAKDLFSSENSDMYSKYRNKKIILDISIPKNYKNEDINIMADELLKEIFINIFSNSIKYNDKSEIISIEITIGEYVLSDWKYWMISICDSGNGISDASKEDLFERFYSKASGTGMGLSIVRALVERYGGRVWASDKNKSSYQYGLCIGMIFPFVDPVQK